MISPVQSRLEKYITERDLLNSYPVEDLVAIIQDVGFLCDGCAQCCTAAFNGHVFLLDSEVDAAQALCSNALIPAPDFDFCDKDGNFYVSGFALRTDSEGNCIFLTDSRCSVYRNRFSICRIYPYMLHQETDEDGKIAFRQISGLNQHGSYYHKIPDDEAKSLASATITYEKAYLNQMIAFCTCLLSLFENKKRRHVQRSYDMLYRQFLAGKPVIIQVFRDNGFIPVTVTRDDYAGIIRSHP